MAQGFFEITNNWTAHNFSAGQWSVKLQNTNATLLVSEDSNGEVVFNSKDFNNGVIPLNVDAQKDFYFKVVGDIDNAKVFYSDAFFFRVKGGGGGGGGGGGNYTFTAPLVDTQGNISIALSQSLKVTQDRLDLNLTANADFKNALLGIDDAKQIATYTSVGRVMPKEHHFQLNALSGELELDLSPTGVLSQGFASKQDFTTLDSEAVKTTNIPQDIDGAKNFVRELSALAIQLKQNSANGGGVDIHSENGYFSISKDNQGVYQLLAGLGYIDNTTSFRIRNLNGGIVTFNTLAQYEGTFTPTDDKDLVHLAYVKQVKADLMALIQQAQGGLTLIGTIPNTKAEVEANYTLLDNFVQQEAGRPKQKGDFIITSDRWGFVYNGTNWVNFGQVSIVIATTTQAGLMMFGTNAGELEDIGGGRAKLIGWDAIEQALRDFDRRISANATNIQQIQTSLRDYARLGADNTFTGNNTFSGSNTFSGVVTHSAPLVISERLRFATTNMSLAPSTNRRGELYLSDGSTGSACRADLNLENISKIKNCPNPTNNGEVANKAYVDNAIISKTGTLADLTTTNKTNLVSAVNEVKADMPKVLPSGTQPTTTDIGNMQVAFVLK